MAIAVKVSDKLMSEAQFQGWLIDLARLLKWEVMHQYDSRKSEGAGFPDLVLMKNGRLIFAELKRQAGRISHAQEGWFAGLEQVVARNQTVEVYMWRPSDRAAIEAVLRA